MKISASLANERRLDAAIAAFIAEVKACEVVDQKLHIMDPNLDAGPHLLRDCPRAGSAPDYQPTDDEINAPLHA